MCLCLRNTITESIRTPSSFPPRAHVLSFLSFLSFFTLFLLLPLFSSSRFPYILRAAFDRESFLSMVTAHVTPRILCVGVPVGSSSGICSILSPLSTSSSSWPFCLFLARNPRWKITFVAGTVTARTLLVSLRVRVICCSKNYCVFMSKSSDRQSPALPFFYAYFLSASFIFSHNLPRGTFF